MSTNRSQPPVTWLFSYPIASADMYYTVVNQRVICVRDDPVHGFHVWGEIPECGTKTAVDLCQVFLEYAKACSAARERDQAYQDMQAFGRRLGGALAEHIRCSTAAGVSKYLGACALECVLEAMNAHFIVEQCGLGLRYVLERCPLCATAERTGLQDVALAHYGINALCQSLIHALEPNLAVHTPADSQAVHTFSVSAPVDQTNRS